MVRPPAICNGCGFSMLSPMNISDSTNIRLIGNICGPCPKCGNHMHIVDGHFNFTDKAIEVLFAPQRTLNELEKLNLLIKESNKKNLSPSEISEKIKSEIPSLTSFANLIPQNRAEWFTLASILIPLIWGSLQNPPPQQSSQNNIVNNITINQYINQNSAGSVSPNAIIKTNNFLKFKLPEVNDPCYCGSGKKYKKCCKP